jgi:hypothetical protein
LNSRTLLLLASAVISLLHAVQHWVHQQPVAHVAWACTALAASVALFIGLPRALRRLLVRGRRAPVRVILLVAVISVGIGVEALFDAGYRWNLGQAQASVAEAQYARAVVAATPFQIQDYYAFQMSLARNAGVIGTIPELEAPATPWTDLRTQRVLSLPLVGLPADLSPTFYVGRQVATQLGKAVATWQKKLAGLEIGHAYINEASVRLGIRAGDELTARIGTQYQFLTISGTLPESHLAIAGPAMFTTMSGVQALYGLSGKASRALVFFTPEIDSGHRSVEQSILAGASNFGQVVLSKTTGTFHVFHSVAQERDASRRLAVGALALVVLACLCLLVMGRRSLPRTQSQYHPPRASSSRQS